MDLDEWELLPSDGFIDHQQNKGNNHISHLSNPKSVIDMNYFQIFIEPQEKTKEIQEDVSSKEQKIKATKHLDVLEACDQGKKSQLFFNKLKENEFVDIKMDSPKSQNKGIMVQVDEKDGKFEEERIINIEKETNLKEKEVMNWDGDDNSGGLNIWKWAMTGFGAVFSFGFLVATISFIALGNNSKEHQSCKSQEFHFQVYANDKRIKQVVKRAKKLNEAIAAVREANLTRAHITIGGYYEGL